MNQIRLLLSFLSLIFYFQANSQINLEGRVLDEKGVAMPYVNVFIDGTSIGTTTNNTGNFFLNVPSKHQNGKIACKFVGYETYKQSISSFQKGNKTITLKPQEVSLAEVIISAKGKDPAYYIIRQAIKNKDKFKFPVDEYKAELYMKGRAYFRKAPDSSKFFIMLGATEDDMTELKQEEGKVVYLTESISKVSYKAPNNIYEELVASKQTGTLPGFSPNRSIYLDNNFYSNKIEGINERGLISPLANNAFSYYEFKLLGKFNENGKVVNRIQVIPKRANDPVFSGEIFIVHDLWNIHSLQLLAGKQQITAPFVDSVTFSQVYQELDNVWIPLSLQSHYFIKVFGFGVSYEISGQYKSYQFNPSFDKKYFGNEVFRVADSVSVNDSIAMQKLRPVVLDSNELVHYNKNDSIARVENSPAYKDSIRRAGNKFNNTNDFLLEYRHRSKDNNVLTVSGFLFSAKYTKVDAWVLEPTLKYRIRDEDNVTHHEVELVPRYSFGRKVLNLHGSYKYNFNRINYANISIGGGSTVRQINANNPIDPFFETYYNYFTEKSFADFLSERFAFIKYEQELFNGLRASFKLNYANRDNLQNLSQLPLSKNYENRGFAPNIQSAFANEITTFNAKFRYRIGQKYASYPGYRQLLRNEKYPELHASYIIAPDGLNQSSFQQIELGLSYALDLKLLGKLNLSGYSGRFLDSKNLGFFDFQHFMGNRVAFINESNRAFQALPYYQFSASEEYAELHARHNFNGFLLNKIPLIRKLKWQSYVAVNTLFTDSRQPYHEAVVGIENIFSIFKVQVASPIIDGKAANPMFMFGASTLFN